MSYSKEHPEFITITCLEWKYLLSDPAYKQIILDSLHFLSAQKRVLIYGFVIMNNHLHLIWQMLGEHAREDVQRDFLRFTSQQILKNLRNEKSPVLSQLLVSGKDRKYQVWERNSLSISLTTDKVFMEKLEYIHENPVRAGICKSNEEYKYSSASFYEKNEKGWDFLVHHKG